MYGEVVGDLIKGAMSTIGVLFWIAFAGVIAILGWISYGLYLWLR